MMSLRRTLQRRRQLRRELGQRPRRGDGGFTLPEVLIAIVLTGVLTAVIASAISVMLRVTPRAEARLAESKDVTFLQTWIPIDLATAINSYDDPSDIVVRADLAANDPFVNYNATPALPGTNVLTLVVPNAQTGELEIIAYRYVNRDGNWQLIRMRITNPGTPDEERSQVGVAHEIPDPPEGWVPGQPVDFAFEVTSRNQVVLRPIGEDVTVKFTSGNTFQTGGAGLSAEQDLTPNDPVTLPDPTAPPSRCGGRIALVLDTSFSVPGYNGGAALESAATGFIDAFTGTPTELTVMGFDAIAYQLYPNLNSTPGSYISLLDATLDANSNGTPEIQEAKNNITALPNVDTPYPPTNGGNPFQMGGSHYYGSRTAAIGWTQLRTSENGQPANTGGTNWEDALHAPFFTQDGALRPSTPELVVFITDGEPNAQRSTFLPVPSPGDNVQAAAIAANAGRSTGARIVGVLVGPGGAALETNLATVVGSNAWNGTGPDDLGNAIAADYFTGSFAQLGEVLRSIMAAQCGGTVTVRKGIESGTPTGLWTYSTETGDQVLDTSTADSITFDFSFEPGVIERTITIREEAKDGFSFVEGRCSVSGVPIDPSSPKVVQQPDGIPGVAVVLGPDEAISCQMISRAE
ncbi:MAG: type II secretion system protein J [Ilumatobacter sp.]|uniref:PulJ/GspJ family protein n=1 Tax=Ilumatobacter sp. TaxID=1967498 RepID=UPI00391CF417